MVSDVGQNQMWEAQYYLHDKHRGLITSGGLGTMGFALPAAVALLAAPALAQEVPALPEPDVVTTLTRMINVTGIFMSFCTGISVYFSWKSPDFILTCLFIRSTS